MIYKEYYKTRNDGVKLFRTIDVIADKNGNPVLDNEGKVIPSGKMILQLPTNIPYSEAIDVENAPFTYAETNKQIEEFEERIM